MRLQLKHASQDKCCTLNGYWLLRNQTNGLKLVDILEILLHSFNII